MAASAIGSMAGGGTQRKSPTNEHLQPEAREACSAQASQYGAVHVNVVQQRTRNEIAVWGTVDDGKELRSFECAFGTKITSFRLRTVAPAQ
jgi:hypothetical protein